MKSVTYVAGAAVAAMIAMAAMSNEAAAVPVGSFEFTPVGAVTFNNGAITDITAGVTTKEYGDAIVNIGGTGIFAGITAGTGLGALTFDLTAPVNFALVAGGFTFNFDAVDVTTLTPNTALAATYTGTVGAGSPSNVGDQVKLSQSCDQS